MHLYDPDTDDVTFSIRKSSNGCYTLKETIPFIATRSHFVSSNIYFQDDMDRLIDERKKLYLSIHPNFTGLFIIKTNGHELPYHNLYNS